MKKSIFAVLAVAAVSSAQAQSSVTLYGLIDEGYLSSTKTEKLDTKLPNVKKTTNNGISAGNTAQSRIGVKATEDLGGGNTAAAVIELGFNNPHATTSTVTDNGQVEPNEVANTSPITIRQGYVAVANKDYGTFSIGRQTTKFHDYLVGADQSGSDNIAGSIYYNRNKTLDRTNGVGYTYSGQFYNLHAGYSQNSGVEETTIYGYGAKRSTGSRGYELAADVKYKGVFGSLAYLHNSADTLNTIDKPFSSTFIKSDAIAANAGYDFGILKASYTYYQVKQDSLLSAQDTSLYLHQVGVSTPLTPVAEVYANYVYGHGAGGKVVTNDVTSYKRSGYQLGARYNLSKRTNLYAAYGVQSDTGDSFTLPSDKNATQAKTDVKTYTVGLKHTF